MIAEMAEVEHEHDWHLVSIDFDGELPVHEYACTSCHEVWFSHTGALTDPS